MGQRRTKGNDTKENHAKKNQKVSLSLLFSLFFFLSSKEPAARVDIKRDDPGGLLEPRVSRVLRHERVLPRRRDPELQLGRTERRVRRRAWGELRGQQQPRAEHPVQQWIRGDRRLDV